MHPMRRLGVLRRDRLGFRVQGFRFGVQGSGFMVQGLDFRVQGLGFGVQVLGLWLEPPISLPGSITKTSRPDSRPYLGYCPPPQPQLDSKYDMVLSSPDRTPNIDCYWVDPLKTLNPKQLNP